MLVRPSIVIKHEGRFKARLHPRNQCGAPGSTEFGVYFEVEAEELDARGFVVDQYEIERIAQRFNDGRWFASCEFLVGGFIHLVHRIMDDRADRILVRVEPNGARSAEMEWRRGMALPKYIPRPADDMTREAAKFAKVNGIAYPQLA